ncbi:MAG: NTP transferase domain-containing protein [Paludibacteraceae bacterium]|nr:NTP transferase domain-containing protein [Paludibacteraceae bacterium]
MKAMLFAAGNGTRLKPFTDLHPKALLPLAGQTLLKYQILRLKEIGCDEIVINTHHFANQIVDYLQQNNNFGININLSYEKELLNTGGGLYNVKDFFVDSPFFLALNVDILSNINLNDLLKAHKQDDIATLVVSQRDTQRYLLFNDENIMRGWTNIKTNEFRPNNIENINSLHKLAFSGMQVLSPKIFQYAADLGDTFSLVDLYLNCCKTENIRAYIPTNYQMMDVGKTEFLAQAEQFAENLKEKGS